MRPGSFAAATSGHDAINKMTSIGGNASSDVPLLGKAESAPSRKKATLSLNMISPRITTTTSKRKNKSGVTNTTNDRKRWKNVVSTRIKVATSVAKSKISVKKLLRSSTRSESYASFSSSRGSPSPTPSPTFNAGSSDAFDNTTGAWTQNYWEYEYNFDPPNQANSAQSSPARSTASQPQSAAFTSLEPDVSLLNDGDGEWVSFNNERKSEFVPDLFASSDINIEDIESPRKSLESDILKIRSSLFDNADQWTALDNERTPEKSSQRHLHRPSSSRGSSNEFAGIETDAGVAFGANTAVETDAMSAFTNISGSNTAVDLACHLSKAQESCSSNNNEEESDMQSVNSIPSLFSTSAEDDDEFFFNDTTNVPVQDKTNDEDVSDSIIAWSILSAVLGSPAPKSVQSKGKTKQAQKNPVNLWQDRDDLVDGIDELMNQSQDSNDGCVVDLEVENIASLSLDDDAHSIPSLSEGAKPDDGTTPDLRDFIVNTPSKDMTNNKDAADSAILWGALAAVLGSPAPSSLDVKSTKKDRRSVVVNLWDDGEESDVISLPCDDFGTNKQYDTMDSISIISLDDYENESDTQSVPDMLEGDHVDATFTAEDTFNNFVINPPEPKAAEKEVTNSVMVWGALAAFMGSPTHRAVSKRTKKDARSSSKNLWAENELVGNDTLDTISLSSESSAGMENAERDVPKTSITQQVHHDQDDCDAHSIPSLNPEQRNDDLNTNEIVNEKPSYDFITPPTTPSKKKDLTGSVIAWSSIAALMCSSEPASATRKRGKGDPSPLKNLWEDDNMLGDDIDELVSLSSSDRSLDTPEHGDCKQNFHFDDIPLIDCDFLDRGSSDDDDHSIPSLISGSEDDDEPSSPLRPMDSYYQDPMTPPRSKSKDKELTGSVIAWGALAAFMGSPAPIALSPKRKKVEGSPARNLWEDDGTVGCEPLDLITLLQDNCASDLPFGLNNMSSENEQVCLIK